MCDKADNNDTGVLMLSQFAHASRELNSALLVNPYENEFVSKAIHHRLIKPLEENDKSLVCELS
ncbi:trehalose-6-phosphate synthase [Pseudochrobactrum kiredjianiae]|uniref:trehalose-6-phosphate synthase n=1 Tax=Pseudochrobactrum kiredjianiae TaxID=386305 RepID=UPI003342759F